MAGIPPQRCGRRFGKEQQMSANLPGDLLEALFEGVFEQPLWASFLDRLHMSDPLPYHQFEDGQVYALEELIGAVEIEDVLDRVFSSFCVGK